MSEQLRRPDRLAGTWPAHDNPYRRRFDAMRKRYAWDDDLPADGTTGFVRSTPAPQRALSSAPGRRGKAVASSCT